MRAHKSLGRTAIDCFKCFACVLKLVAQALSTFILCSDIDIYRLVHTVSNISIIIFCIWPKIISSLFTQKHRSSYGCHKKYKPVYKLAKSTYTPDMESLVDDGFVYDFYINVMKVAWWVKCLLSSNNRYLCLFNVSIDNLPIGFHKTILYHNIQYIDIVI